MRRYALQSFQSLRPNSLELSQTPRPGTAASVPAIPEDRTSWVASTATWWSRPRCAPTAGVVRPARRTGWTLSRRDSWPDSSPALTAVCPKKCEGADARGEHRQPGTGDRQTWRASLFSFPLRWSSVGAHTQRSYFCVACARPHSADRDGRCEAPLHCPRRHPVSALAFQLTMQVPARPARRAGARTEYDSHPSPAGRRRSAVDHRRSARAPTMGPVGR